VSDHFVSWVRTVVPALWSTLVASLASLGLPPAITSAVAGLVDVLVALAGVYALLRWIEPQLPKWLAVVLLGSVRSPVYPPRDA
jgi:hypothetical protein